MIKYLILAAIIYVVYKWYRVPAISSPKDADEDDFVEYEEVD